MMSKYYITPSGKLYYDMQKFMKLCVPVDGVSTTEMWDSALVRYDGRPNSNIENGVLWDINKVPDERHNIPHLEFVRFDLTEINDGK